MHEGLRGGRGERESEVCNMEGEDVGPACHEVELVERVHLGQAVAGFGVWFRFGRMGSLRRASRLHVCIAWTSEDVRVALNA